MSCQLTDLILEGTCTNNADATAVRSDQSKPASDNSTQTVQSTSETCSVPDSGERHLSEVDKNKEFQKLLRMIRAGESVSMITDMVRNGEMGALITDMMRTGNLGTMLNELMRCGETGTMVAELMRNEHYNVNITDKMKRERDSKTRVARRMDDSVVKKLSVIDGVLRKQLKEKSGEKASEITYESDSCEHCLVLDNLSSDVQEYVNQSRKHAWSTLPNNVECMQYGLAPNLKNLLQTTSRVNSDATELDLLLDCLEVAVKNYSYADAISIIFVVSSTTRLVLNTMDLISRLSDVAKPPQMMVEYVVALLAYGMFSDAVRELDALIRGVDSYENDQFSETVYWKYKSREQCHSCAAAYFHLRGVSLMRVGMWTDAACELVRSLHYTLGLENTDHDLVKRCLGALCDTLQNITQTEFQKLSMIIDFDEETPEIQTYKLLGLLGWHAETFHTRAELYFRMLVNKSDENDVAAYGFDEWTKCTDFTCLEWPLDNKSVRLVYTIGIWLKQRSRDAGSAIDLARAAYLLSCQERYRIPMCHDDRDCDEIVHRIREEISLLLKQYCNCLPNLPSSDEYPRLRSTASQNSPTRNMSQILPTTNTFSPPEVLSLSCTNAARNREDAVNKNLDLGVISNRATMVRTQIVHSKAAAAGPAFSETDEEAADLVDSTATTVTKPTDIPVDPTATTEIKNDNSLSNATIYSHEISVEENTCKNSYSGGVEQTNITKSVATEVLEGAQPERKSERPKSTNEVTTFYGQIRSKISEIATIIPGTSLKEWFVYEANFREYSAESNTWRNRKALVCVELKLKPTKEGRIRELVLLDCALHHREYVGKYYRRPRPLNEYEEDIIKHQIARYLVSEFNRELRGKHATKALNLWMLDSALVQLVDDGRVIQNLHVEPRIRPRFDKFTSNTRFVNDKVDTDLLLAFSHYTWSKTAGELVVTDLQGWIPINQDATIILTDPCIQSEKLFLGDSTNMLNDGFHYFWNVQHRTCNDICRSLNLFRDPEEL